MLKVFVYGALMHTRVIKRNGMAARLNGHQVSFTIKGLPPWEPAFAELIEAPGQEAWGVMAEVTVDEWHKLRRHEISYGEKKVLVQTQNNQIVECIALVQKAPHSQQEAIPSARYMRMLYRSACSYQFPTQVIAQYKTLYDQGNSCTLYMPWILPITKMLIPYFGAKKSFYTSFIGIPLCILILFIGWIR